MMSDGRWMMYELNNENQNENSLTVIMADG